MEFTRIIGGKRLCGSIQISGSKNACLPILAASILTDEECFIKNIPKLSDVTTMVDILRSVGAEVSYCDKNSLRIKADNITSEPDKCSVRKMRGSICLIGALIARTGHVIIPIPGGCVIGNRPIDLHIKGLHALGCNIIEKDDNLVIDGSNLRGTTVDMLGKQGSTVTGTINILLAALSADGQTIIEDAAIEPEVVDFCKYLIAMGAEIKGIGTSTLRIIGGKKLHGCEYTVMGDRVEAGTLVCAALITRGSSEICGLGKELLNTFIDELRNIGANVFQNFDGRIYVKSDRQLSNANICTGPHPNFPTDLQAQFSTLLTQAEGVSCVKENIYPDRFNYAQELRKMGAVIDLGYASANIQGSCQLIGTEVEASDLRASAALYLAGLCAKGETRIYNVHHLDRGYENFESKLKILGANIERVKT